MIEYNKRAREEGRTPLEQTQIVLFEILKVVDAICRNHDIKYWLSGGTLLGAIRHKGFIPWDDDADIAMERKDYEKFIKIINENLPNGLFFQSSKTDKKRSKWARIRDNYSTINLKSEQNKNYTYHKGIFLDVFPYDIIDRDFYNTKVFFTRRFKKSKNKHLKKYRHILQPISKLTHYALGPNTWKKLILRNYAKGKPKLLATGIEIGDFFYNISYTNVFPISDNDSFLGYRFMMPANPDKYLTEMFDNYMQIPPEEERVVHSYELLPFTKCNHPRALDYYDEQT
ncbi:LicD family protein [Carboxylicivirga marina]|uniref:LicD family protein n=1 Tax=Carboxylicivirga marina TaxID=2800988 RepID=UPI00259A69F0|nr:LicD family protein [uncultured Carboxylicivirga sp.]